MAQETTFKLKTKQVGEGDNATFKVTFTGPAAGAKKWSFTLEWYNGQTWVLVPLAVAVLETDPAKLKNVEVRTAALAPVDAGEYRAVVTEEIPALGGSLASSTPFPSVKTATLHVGSVWQEVISIYFRWSAQKKRGSVCVKLDKKPTPSGKPSKNQKVYDYLWRLGADEFQAITSLWFNKESTTKKKLYYHSNLKLFGLASAEVGSDEFPEPEDHP